MSKIYNKTLLAYIGVCLVLLMLLCLCMGRLAGYSEGYTAASRTLECISDKEASVQVCKDLYTNF